MEHDKLTKSHGILLPVMEFYQFCLQLYQICMLFATTKKLSIELESPHFQMFSAKRQECKINKRNGHGKLRNGHGKVTEKYFVKSVGTLIDIIVLIRATTQKVYSGTLYGVMFSLEQTQDEGNNTEYLSCYHD